jgi:hypothetical protein
MLDWLSARLTYANVMATLAVFIALGGSSYAAIRINGSQIQNKSISYKKIKRNTLGGTRIRESRLRKVRRARHADRLNGVTAAALRLRCPNGTRAYADACVEVAARSGTTYSAARDVCGSGGRRLPSYDELVGVVDDQDVALGGGGELTLHVVASSSRPGFVQVLVVTDDFGAVGVAESNETKAFRCVVDPSQAEIGRGRRGR